MQRSLEVLEPEADQSGEQVRRSLAANGCVLLRAALPRAAMAALGDAMMAELARQGYAGEDGAWTGMAVEDVDDDAVNAAIPYQDVWTSPSVTDLFERVVGGDVFVFRNSLTRYVAADGAAYITGAHQDAWLVKPNEDFVGVWAPLRPGSIELGGVEYAIGSHHAGLREHRPEPVLSNLRFDRKPQQGIAAETITEPWARAVLDVGDVIFFTALTVHRSIPNSTERGIRCSIDTRIQPATSERGFTATHTMEEIKAAKDQAVHAEYGQDPITKQ